MVGFPDGVLHLAKPEPGYGDGVETLREPHRKPVVRRISLKIENREPKVASMSTP
ncbi:hypothetical protein TWF694_010939 [Orbilia ellipsospora]|uniref:Uncharacterized protein n=1 Tax=Orbilia ellipsospora TaxID=2528407 RepID=A0AAV9X8N6_9PEZI